MKKIQQTVPTYIINLQSRPDRKEHILKEFANRDEFSINIVKAHEHKIGAVGLWSTIKHIVQDLADPEQEMIIICEDDHLFTGDYSKETLFNCISKAQDMDADILFGGVSWFKGALQVSSDIFWVDHFTGTQFMIVFNKFFRKIIEAEFIINDIADHKIATLTADKFFIHPFISIQKEFGYSDATVDNNKEGRVEDLFRKSSENGWMLKEVAAYYKHNPARVDVDTETLNTLAIPTYIINLPERTERREHILQQFSGRPEFDITLVNAIKHETGAYGLWLTIREIIKMAIKNEDDVIVISEDDHEFTSAYSKELFIKNIMEAHAQGADYLSGGTGGFSFAIPITPNRYWLNPCFSTQFIIIFKKFFDRILAEPFDEEVIADILLPSMTSHKMVMYPFISNQKDFGYSDASPVHENDKGMIRRIFIRSSRTMEKLQQAYMKYNLSTAEY